MRAALSSTPARPRWPASSRSAGTSNRCSARPISRSCPTISITTTTHRPISRSIRLCDRPCDRGIDEGGADMSSIIEFPIADKPITESEIDKLHGDAFRDLETNLRDCVRMSGIAAELILRATPEDRELAFAVVHAMEMLTALKANYYAAWHGERKP